MPHPEFTLDDLDAAALAALDEGRKRRARLLQSQTEGQPTDDSLQARVAAAMQRRREARAAAEGPNRFRLA